MARFSNPKYYTKASDVVLEDWPWPRGHSIGLGLGPSGLGLEGPGLGLCGIWSWLQGFLT
jgi:hypothetical protein